MKCPCWARKSRNRKLSTNIDLIRGPAQRTCRRVLFRSRRIFLRSSSDSPPHTPESWLVLSANSRQRSLTEQSPQTTFAAAIWRRALPVEPMGKKTVGSISRHFAVFRQRPLSSSMVPRELTSIFPPGATREGVHEHLCRQSLTCPRRKTAKRPIGRLRRGLACVAVTQSQRYDRLRLER